MGLFRKIVSRPVRWAGFFGGMWANMRLTWRLLRDPRVGLAVKLILPAVAIAYLLSPASLLQAVPLVGEVDDVAVAMLAINLFLRFAPRQIVAEHRSELEHPTPPAEEVDATYRVVR